MFTSDNKLLNYNNSALILFATIATLSKFQLKIAHKLIATN